MGFAANLAVLLGLRRRPRQRRVRRGWGRGRSHPPYFRSRLLLGRKWRRERRWRWQRWRKTRRRRRQGCRRQGRGWGRLRRRRLTKSGLRWRWLSHLGGRRWRCVCRCRGSGWVRRRAGWDWGGRTGIRPMLRIRRGRPRFRARFKHHGNARWGQWLRRRGNLRPGQDQQPKQQVDQQRAEQHRPQTVSPSA